MILRKFIFCTYFFTCKVDIIIVPFEDYMTLYVQVLRTAPDTESAHYFPGYKNKLFLFPWLMRKSCLFLLSYHSSSLTHRSLPSTPTSLPSSLMLKPPSAHIPPDECQSTDHYSLKLCCRTASVLLFHPDQLSSSSAVGVSCSAL